MIKTEVDCCKVLSTLASLEKYGGSYDELLEASMEAKQAIQWLLDQFKTEEQLKEKYLEKWLKNSK